MGPKINALLQVRSVKCFHSSWMIKKSLWQNSVPLDNILTETQLGAF